MRRSTQEEVIAKFHKVHEVNRYDYSRVVVVNNKTKVEIGCKIHGSL